MNRTNYINLYNSGENSKPLTAREKKVADLIMLGYGNKKIAATIHRTERTVKQHVANTFQKLKVETRHELISKVYHEKIRNMLESNKISEQIATELKSFF